VLDMVDAASNSANLGAFRQGLAAYLGLTIPPSLLQRADQVIEYAIPELIAALDAFMQDHRRCGDLNGGVKA
jgi:hypothetical protein